MLMFFSRILQNSSKGERKVHVMCGKICIFAKPINENNEINY